MPSPGTRNYLSQAFVGVLRSSAQGLLSTRPRPFSHLAPATETGTGRIRAYKGEGQGEERNGCYELWRRRWINGKL
eukprot:scaffold2104_cov120-Isochrysis_galbana.AAC.8